MQNISRICLKRRTKSGQFFLSKNVLSTTFQSKFLSLKYASIFQNKCSNVSYKYSNYDYIFIALILWLKSIIPENYLIPYLIPHHIKLKFLLSLGFSSLLSSGKFVSNSFEDDDEELSFSFCFFLFVYLFWMLPIFLNFTTDRALFFFPFINVSNFSSFFDLLFLTMSLVFTSDRLPTQCTDFLLF